MHHSVLHAAKEITKKTTTQALLSWRAQTQLKQKTTVYILYIVCLRYRVERSVIQVLRVPKMYCLGLVWNLMYTMLRFCFVFAQLLSIKEKNKTAFSGAERVLLDRCITRTAIQRRSHSNSRLYKCNWMRAIITTTTTSIIIITTEIVIAISLSKSAAETQTAAYDGYAFAEHMGMRLRMR